LPSYLYQRKLLNKQLIEKILFNAKTAKIAVVGDFCLDVYWFLNEIASEKSLETDLPTWPIAEQEYSLGGAGNVVNNLHALGCENIHVFGVVGTDPWGQILMQNLYKLNVNCEGIITQEKHWATPAYVKPYKKQNELNRIDFGNFNKLDSYTLNSLLSCLEKELPELEIVIISQQIEGSLFVDEFIEKLLIFIDKFCDTLFIVDSRHNSDDFPGAILKLNDFIAERMVGNNTPKGDSGTRENAIKTAKILCKKLKKTIFITCGINGCILVDEGVIKEIPSIKTTGKIDTVGAGDSMLAGICIGLVSGEDAYNSACLGNLAAAVSIQKLYQTGTVSPEELLMMAS
jgi:rfaE bifunctional protein kinase chain/domain